MADETKTPGAELTKFVRGDGWTNLVSGLGTIEHPWFNDATETLEADGRSTSVRWVAIRGGIEDWAIYHSLNANLCPFPNLDNPCHLEATADQIANHGAKMHRDEIIRQWVPCDDEAFGWYRH